MEAAVNSGVLLFSDFDLLLRRGESGRAYDELRDILNDFIKFLCDPAFTLQDFFQEIAAIANGGAGREVGEGRNARLLERVVLGQQDLEAVLLDGRILELALH